MAWTKSLLGTNYLRPLLQHSWRHELPKVIDAAAWFHNKMSWLQVLKVSNPQSGILFKIFEVADLFWDWPLEWKWQVYPSAPKEAFRKMRQTIWLALKFLFSCQVSFLEKLLCIKLTLKLLAPPLLLSTPTSITTDSKTGQFYHKENTFPCGN